MRFTQKRYSGLNYEWFEAQLTLRGVSGKLAEDVNVALGVRFSTPKGKFVYYGESRLYALERTAVVRFYLPGDVVRAYGLPITPEAYLVELSSSSGKEPFERVMSSVSLKTDKEREEFKTSAKKNLPSRRLLSHYQTPFYSLSETWKDLPAYVIP